MYREQRVACELRVEQVPRKDQSFNQILRHLVYTFEQTRKETQTATWAMLKWRWFFFSVYLLDCQTKTFHSPSVTLEHDTLPVRIPAWCQDTLSVRIHAWCEHTLSVRIPAWCQDTLSVRIPAWCQDTLSVRIPAWCQDTLSVRIHCQ